jgi:PleD family two-component response regulator
MAERSARKAKGSEGVGFTVDLPLAQEREIRRARKNADVKSNGVAVAAARVRLDGVHVLLVEDDDDSRKLLGTMLKRYGARVTSTKSAAEALRFLTVSCRT